MTPSPGRNTAPLKVLWVTKVVGLGGSEKLLLDYATMIDHGSFEISWAYTTVRDQRLVDGLSASGVRCRELSSAKGGVLGQIGALARLVNSEDWDIVHVHSPLLGSFARVSARLKLKRRPRVLTTEHNSWRSFHPLTRLINRVTMHLSDHVIAVSADTYESMSTRSQKKTEIVVQGIPLDRFRLEGLPSSLPPTKMETSLGQAPRIVTVANFRKQKDHKTLLKALALLRDRGVIFEAALVGDGPLRRSISIEVARLNLGGIVSMLGRRSDIPGILQRCDLFVLTSQVEGGAPPIAVMEALAMGLPIVASNIGSVREGLDQSEAVAFFEPGDWRSLANLIEDLLEEPDRMSRMAAAARVFAERFDLRIVVRQLEGLYTELATGR